MLFLPFLCPTIAMNAIQIMLWLIPTHRQLMSALRVYSIWARLVKKITAEPMLPVIKPSANGVSQIK